MNQPAPAGSPLMAKMYRLDHPRSLGVYSTYEEVQAVVDALADHDFPVQDTMIVGTDLKLIERVTGRQTWGRVILNGILSGLWLGLFIGLLFQVLRDAGIGMLITSALMGALFFTVWSVIGYAMTRGKRDFTSRVATIPMQYELMVEHRDLEHARRVLIDAGALMPDPAPVAPARPRPANRPSYGLPGPEQSAPPQHPAPQHAAPEQPTPPRHPAPPQSPTTRPGSDTSRDDDADRPTAH